MVGWLFIGFAAILLLVFSLLLKDRKVYSARRRPEIDALITARSTALERGRKQHILLGHQLWSGAFPGLGLHSLLVLPSLLDPETGVDGGLMVDGGDGTLVVFAQQIVENRYDDGFSTTLHNKNVNTTLSGPMPLAFTAGFLSEISLQPQGSLILLGNYGPESLLWTEAAASDGAHVFAATGTIASQAALFSSVRDSLLGEEIFALPGALESTSTNRAGWLTEDILRIILMLSLTAAAILKIVGVL